MKCKTQMRVRRIYTNHITSRIATCRAESDIEIASRKANSLVDFRKLQGKRTPAATCC